MSGNNRNGHEPNKNAENTPLTELDFDSFLNDAPQEPQLDASVKSDIEETEKSLEADIRGLYEDILGSTPISDSPVLPTEQPEQTSPFVPVSLDAAEASPDEPEVFYNPAPTQEEAPVQQPPAEEPDEDFGAVIAGALGELDSLLDDIYGVPTSPKKEAEKAAPMEDISSNSAPNDFDTPAPDFGVVSPEELDFLAPPSASAPADSEKEIFSHSDNYFLGKAPATAPGTVQAPLFSGAAVPKKGQPGTQDKPSSEEAKKVSAIFPARGDSAGEIVRKIVLMVSLVTIVVSSGILVNSYFIEPYRFSVQADKAIDDLLAVDDSGNIHESDISAVSADNPDTVYPEDLLKKYYKLYAANNDLAGWVNIPALQINLPLVQGNDNSYYLKRDVYGKRTKYGVPFFDYRNSLRVLNRNTVIYGHNMEYDDLIFGMLENYRTIEGYKSAPVIECNTIYSDYNWLVYGVFVTNGKAKDDNGYIFNYNFTELDNFTFLEYIDQVDQRKLYSTGVDIVSTDKILTLSTCCYDFGSARLVVVARLLREGESIHVSTSNTVANPNPRYPQAWYDAQSKTNPYANSEKWVAYADMN